MDVTTITNLLNYVEHLKMEAEEMLLYAREEIRLYEIHQEQQYLDRSAKFLEFYAFRTELIVAILNEIENRMNQGLDDTI